MPERNETRSVAYTPESLFRAGERVRYDEFTGRVVGVSWTGGVLQGYRIEWDDGYVDDPSAPLYSDAELEPARDARDSR